MAPSISHSEPCTIMAHQAASNPSRTHHSLPHRVEAKVLERHSRPFRIGSSQAPLPATPWHHPPFAWDSCVAIVHAVLHLNGPSLSHSPTVGFKTKCHHHCLLQSPPWLSRHSLLSHASTLACWHLFYYIHHGILQMSYCIPFQGGFRWHSKRHEGKTYTAKPIESWQT